MKNFAFAAAAALSIAVPAVGHAAVLFDNGPVVSGGLSVLTPPEALLGLGAQSTVPNRVADNFSVGGSGWNVQTLDFYSYQTGAVGFTFTSATWSIVSGANVNTGAVVASGTTAVTSGGLLGYRVTSTTLTNQDRAIYRLSADIPDLVLAAGNYFMIWSMAGTSPSGPWAPPVVGSLGTGNALQSISNAAFIPAIDTGSQQGLDVPFTINGTRIAVAGAVPEPASWLMMLAGFGLIGAGMRRRRTSALRLV